MAIDPKLMVIKPVSELEKVTGLQDGAMLFYDGGGNLKTIDVATFNNISKSAKLIGVNDPTPTEVGLYKPKTSSKDNIDIDPINYGTLYTNAGNLRAKAGYDTLFYFNGTTWSKSEVEMPVPIQNITQNINNNTYNLDPQQIVPSEALYTDDTLAGDILKRVDKSTGEDVNYRETTTWHNGNAMDDSKVDGVIYKKIGIKYFVRQIENEINLKWWGNYENENGDATDAINATLKWASIFKKTANIPFSTYLVSAKNLTPEQVNNGNYEAIRIPSNVNIKFNYSIFKLTTVDKEWYKIINFQNAENVKFDNVKVIGDKENHTGTTGEWGYGVAFSNCQNIFFDSIEAVDCWGDGVYFGNVFYFTGLKSIENIFGRLIKTDNCRRNGVAITMGKNIIIDTIISKNIKGTNPEAGVDFECEYDGDLPIVFENILINNIYTENCNQDGICLAMFLFSEHLDKKFDITINNFTDISSHRALSSYNSKLPSNGVINIKNLNTKYNKSSGIYFSNKSVNSEFINIENLNIEEWGKVDVDDASKHAIHLSAGAGMDGSQIFGNIQLKNIILKDITTSHNVVTKALSGRNSKFLTLDFWKVSGCWNGLTPSEVTDIRFVDNNNQLNIS